MGVIRKGSRFDKYRVYFSTLDSAYKAKRLQEVLNNQNIGTYCSIINDCVELIKIHQGLVQIDASPYLAKLKSYASGPDFPVNENTSSSNKARNTGFELAMISLFVRAGFVNIPAQIADARFNINGLEYYLECKRPQKASSIGKNLSESLSQLKNRIGPYNQRKRRAIFAISLNKVVNPYTSLLPVGQLPQVSVLYNAMSDAFENEHKKRWFKFSDRRLVAGIMHVNAVVFVVDKMMMTTTEWAQLFSIENKGTSDETEINQIGAALNLVIQPS